MSKIPALTKAGNILQRGIALNSYLKTYYNPRVKSVETEELRILLALEPVWTVSIGGREFMSLHASEIAVDDSVIRFGRYTRKILNVCWLRPNVVRISARGRFRTQTEVLTFYAGERLPSVLEIQRRRRSFQKQIAQALAEHFKTRSISRQTLYSDKRHGIGGSYPRFLLGSPLERAVIAVDPDESSFVVNGIMRAAILWSKLLRRRTTVVAPAHRRHTIVTRLKSMPALQSGFDWLQWDGEKISRLQLDSVEPETRVHEYYEPNVRSAVDSIRGLAPDLLQAVPHIQGRAVSVRLRGLEVARVAEGGVIYPLGEPLQPLIESIARERRHGSRHPLARAQEERWLESTLIAHIRQVLPVRPDAVYPQVPSFAGEERNIVDLLTMTETGRLVVIEIKATADPDLPFQAFDYWLAVERHRKAGDFERQGYFRGLTIQDQPALLVMLAPLLAFHRTLDDLTAVLPRNMPLVQIGINQTWKKEIKILRRKGSVS